MTLQAASPRKFLVIADGSVEFAAALRFACRRARSTDGTVAILRVIAPVVFEHWSGVRDEIERQARAEAAEEVQAFAPLVRAETGHDPEVLLIRADDTREALRRVISADRDIKILVLAAATGGRGPPSPGRGSAGADATFPSPSSPAIFPTPRSMTSPEPRGNLHP